MDRAVKTESVGGSCEEEKKTWVLETIREGLKLKMPG